MRQNGGRVDRRAFLAFLAAFGAAVPFARPAAFAVVPARLTRPIPSTGERVPVIGMGSWITFSVGDDQAERAVRVEVLRAFFKAGGGLVDSSPMYGSSEDVIGYCLDRLGRPPSLFSATKVWTPFQWHGVRQVETSQTLWGEDRFDLLQIHNLLSWRRHMETLLALKAKGRVKYIGVTTSHGRRHGDLEQIMAEQPLDFVQFTYNIVDREAEERLLPLAAELGLAVIVNRPFQGGSLFDIVRGRPLPPWAAAFDCANWAQFFLKFVVSHPAVTCAIPATSQPAHMGENMGASLGHLPDPETRQRMIRYVETI